MLTLTSLLLAAAEINLISFLIWLIIVLLLVGLVFYVLNHFFPTLPEPVRTIIIVNIALILLAIAARQLGVL
jgi:hypothetical protein